MIALGIALIAAGATLPWWQPRLIEALIARIEQRTGLAVELHETRTLLSGRVSVERLDARRGAWSIHCDDVVVRARIRDVIRGIPGVASVRATACEVSREIDTSDDGAGTPGTEPSSLVPDISAMLARLDTMNGRLPDIDIESVVLNNDQRSARVDAFSIRHEGVSTVHGRLTAAASGVAFNDVGFQATITTDGVALRLLDPFRAGPLTVGAPEVFWGPDGVAVTNLNTATLAGEALGNVAAIELSGTRACPRVRVRGAVLNVPEILLPEQLRSRSGTARPDDEVADPVADGANADGVGADPGTDVEPTVAGDDAGPSPGQRATAQLGLLARQLDARLQSLPSERCFELSVVESRITVGAVVAEIRSMQRSADGLLRADGRLNDLDLRVDADGRRLEWAELTVSGINISRMFGGDSNARSQGDVAFGGRVTRMPGRSFHFVGATTLRDAGFEHAGVSPLPLAGIDAQLNVSASVAFAEAAEVAVRLAGYVEEVPVTGHLDLQTVGGTQALQLEAGVAGMVPCDAMWRAIPEGFLPNLTHAAVSFRGEASPRIAVTYELARPESFSLSAGSFLSGCVIERVRGEFDPRRLNDDNYIHHVTEGTTLQDLEVGPGTDSYVRLDELPGYVPAAMYLSEEINFFTNPGVSVGLITRGMRLNLERMRYAYGGSTVSQQLVKNLFLSRSKTLSRKLEEAILVMAMEQWVSKFRILELYMNCIEFGPNIYGIQNAARYYFGRDASELTPLEAVYLANLKPSPLSGGRHLARGHTPETGWWIERTPMMLQRLVDYGGFIEPEEVAHYAPWVVALPGESGNENPLYPRILRPVSPATKVPRSIRDFVSYQEPP
jgi:hypothetical protein